LGIETGGVWAIAADTDGIDGAEDNAGAVLTPDRMRLGRDARALLAKHDSYGFFRTLAAWSQQVLLAPTSTTTARFSCSAKPVKQGTDHV
jgi:glycerate 2-kinase